MLIYHIHNNVFIIKLLPFLFECVGIHECVGTQTVQEDLICLSCKFIEKMKINVIKLCEC